MYTFFKIPNYVFISVIFFAKALMKVEFIPEYYYKIH